MRTSSETPTEGTLAIRRAGRSQAHVSPSLLYTRQIMARRAIDFTRGRMLIVGDYSAPFPRGCAIFHPVRCPSNSVVFGPDVLKMNGDSDPCAIFDEKRDRFLVFKNTSPVSG